MNDLAKRLVIAVILFFLVAFGFIKMQQLAAVEAENTRLTEVNAGLDSTASHWKDSTSVLGTALVATVERADSLAARTGPIRWRTRTITVIEPGTIDTVRITDSIPIIDGQPIPIPVALELTECRVLVRTCDEFKHTADSTINWQATHIDTLQAQITNLDKRFSVPQLALLGLSLPLPALTIGYGVMYSLNECSDEVSFSQDDISGSISGNCDRFHHGPVLGLTWQVWSP